MDNKEYKRYCHECDAWDPDLSICNSHYEKVEIKCVPLISYCRDCGLIDLLEHLANFRNHRGFLFRPCPTVAYKIKKKAIKFFHDDILDMYAEDMGKFRGCDMPEIMACIDRINRYPIKENGRTIQAVNKLIDLSQIKRKDDEYSDSE